MTESKTKVFITLHQEDTRIKQVDKCRPYIDIGIALLRRKSDGLELVDLKDFADMRQVELEVNLYPGSYIVVPRTTGCTIPHPAKQDDKQKKKESQLPLFVEVGKDDEFYQRLDKTQKRTLTPRLESAISEIFNKFDIGHKKYLTYEEFKAFNKVITEENTSESQFKEYLKRFHSTGKYTPKPGMTLLGLKMFFFEFIRVKG